MNRQELLIKILKEKLITVFFQPIIDLKTSEAIGYEALSRGPGDSELHSPLELIKEAGERGLLCELELLLKTTAIERAAQLGLDRLLFLNVEPSVMNDEAFTGCMSVSFFNRHGISSSAIVIELTERMVTLDLEAYKNNVINYKNTGINVALEASGGEFVNLFATSQPGPKYMKMDQSLIRGVNEDMARQSLIRAFVTLASLTNTKLIAEGIETAEELKTLMKLGVGAGQGYFLAKPAEGLCGITAEARGIISWFIGRTVDIPSKTIHSIGSISERVPAYEDDTPCKEVKKVLEKFQYEGVCVVGSNGITGLMMKKQLDAMLASQYGFALFAGKPVSRIVDTHCIVVDYYTSIKDVADLVFVRPQQKIYDNIIVTRGNSYYGMVTVINLLKYAMEIQYNSALERNPLTQLPGNTLINDKLTELILNDTRACVLYFDLNNFKAYNDVYGFGRGDALITLTKNVICSVFKPDEKAENFIGHIGGDDFVVVSGLDIRKCGKLCETLLKRFNLSVPEYYNEVDRKNGFIRAEGRSHKLKTYPLTQLSVGGLYGCFGCFKNPDELAGYISRLKKLAKGYSESTYVIEELGNNKMYSNAMQV